MGFEDSLDRQKLPPRVGEVRLTFEGSFFLGVSDRPANRFTPELLHVTAVASGLFALAALLFSARLWLAAALAALTGALTFLATLERRRLRGRRAFSLNFGTESLRIDFVEGHRSRERMEVVPFDAVEAVEVVKGERFFRLEVVYLTDRGRRRRGLIERARPEEIEALRRLWRTLRNAFGLVGFTPPSEGR